MKFRQKATILLINDFRTLVLECGSIMTSYFDEHNCEELGPGQTPDHLMHFARLLIDTGAWNEVGSIAKMNTRCSFL